MSRVKEIMPGLIELTTDKHIADLEQDEDVVAIYQDFSDSDQYKVLVDMSDVMYDEKRYIH